ncbi:hypothetical protein BDZ97DRAFT_1809589 [Flammula alnicola]|nr:hypothetical protein BDZ97DRAFT_1809589 [Flammula alnicola]
MSSYCTDKQRHVDTLVVSFPGNMWQTFQGLDNALGSASAAGLVFLFYDHILSFADEVEYVWKAKCTFTKFLFLLVRYIVPCALLLHIYQLIQSTRNDGVDKFCQVWFNLAVCLGILSMGTGNFLVLLRLWIIWKRNTRLILCTLSLFVLAQASVVICAVIVLVRVSPSLSFDPDLRLCTLQKRSILGVLYAPPVVFDGIALLSVVWNALGHPRTSQSILVQYLCRDRFVYILLLFLMRLANLAITLCGPLHMVILGIWCVAYFHNLAH